jgi:hypothetical protein
MLTALALVEQAPAEDHMPPTKPLHRSAAVLTTIALTATGCGHKDKGPTVTQAEQKLTEHISDALVRLKRGGADGIKMVAQKGNSSHCSDKGTEQRGVLVTGHISDPQAQDPTDISGILVGSLDGEGYKVTYVKPGDPTVRLHNAKSRTGILVTSPSKGKLLMSGTTDCLRVK